MCFRSLLGRVQVLFKVISVYWISSVHWTAGWLVPSSQGEARCWRYGFYGDIRISEGVSNWLFHNDLTFNWYLPGYLHYIPIYLTAIGIQWILKYSCPVFLQNGIPYWWVPVSCWFWMSLILSQWNGMTISKIGQFSARKFLPQITTRLIIQHRKANRWFFLRNRWRNTMAPSPIQRVPIARR